MRIIIAPDSFKGSLSAMQAAEAMQKGVLQIFEDAETVLLPIADGGEGTVEALVAATGGTLRHSAVHDPLGRETVAAWGVLGDGKTAVLEMAEASGLTLLQPAERNPLISSSAGTGELVKAALAEGFRKIILGIGGSATNDGGAGFATALGFSFLAADGKALGPGGKELSRLAGINSVNTLKELAELEISVACDVNNPLCGPRGASAVFGPQKGADQEMVKVLDDALCHYGKIAAEYTGIDAAAVPGAGAAGGLGAALLFFCRARLRSGIEIVLEALNFAQRAKGADLILTGEGYSDQQTAGGKAPVGVAGAAKELGIPVICISGGLGQGYAEMFDCGVAAASSCAPGPISLAEAMDKAAELLCEASMRSCRLLRTGMLLEKKRWRAP